MIIFFILGLGYALAYAVVGLVAIAIHLGFAVASMTLTERIGMLFILIVIAGLARKAAK